MSYDNHGDFKAIINNNTGCYDVAVFAGMTKSACEQVRKWR